MHRVVPVRRRLMNISARQDKVITGMNEDTGILTRPWTDHKDISSEEHPSQNCYHHDRPVVDSKSS